jgi:hypothetical protein
MKIIYDWRFTADQFISSPKPLRLILLSLSLENFTSDSIENTSSNNVPTVTVAVA